MCAYVCVRFGGVRSCEHTVCGANVEVFTLALCMQFVLARRVLMSPGCSQCGEEGGSVHGRRAGRQSRQSAGEPAGQWRYGDGYNSDDYFSIYFSQGILPLKMHVGTLMLFFSLSS